MTNLILFDDYGSKGDPGTWVPFKVAPGEIAKARDRVASHDLFNPDEFPESSLLKIRPLTLAEDTEIEQHNRSAKESLRMHIKGGQRGKERDTEADIQIDRKADLDRKIKRAVSALVDASVTIGVATDESAAEWSKAVGFPVAVGPLYLRGKLTDAARVKFVTSYATILDFVLKTSDSLQLEAGESFEDEAKN